MKTVASLFAFVLIAGITYGCGEAAETTLATAQDPVPAAWTPPQSKVIPKTFIEAAEFMLKHGFADPRGGKLSCAEVNKGSVWTGQLGPEKVIGWLMPKKHGKPQRIVTPNGLSYEVTKVFGSAKVEDLLKGQNRLTAAYPASFETSPIPCLLLAGDIKGAEQFYTAHYKRADVRTDQPPFIALANGYLISRFHRAVEAHMSGDDALALSDAASLYKNWDAFEKEATRLASPEYLRRFDRSNGTLPIKAFAFLEPVKDLAADSARRVSEGQKPFDINAIKGLPADERVKRLIDALDQVSAKQWGQPGGVLLYGDPVISALVNEGSAAAEPLIDAIENDRRLTRTVTFGRDFMPGRYILPVKSAAYSAFMLIAETDQIAPQGQIPDAQTLRKYWRENGGITPAERWVKTLIDDNAGAKQWLDAATRLTDPEGMIRQGSLRTGSLGQAGRMRGESLRDRTGPSVSDLMAMRVVDCIGPDDYNHVPHEFDLAHGLQMAMHLHKWDRDASLKSLQFATQKTIEIALRPHHYVGDFAGKLLAEAIQARVELGDSAALDDFSGWIKNQKQDASLGDARYFIPLLKNSHDPRMRQLAESVFAGAGSTWNIKELAIRQPATGQAETLVFSPLLTIGVVQRQVLSVLSDKRPIAETWVDKNSVHTSHPHGSWGRSLDKDDLNDPRLPKPNAKLKYRLCDSMAERLQRLKGAPKFEAYWPEKDRDKAVAQLIAFLEKNKDRMMDVLPWPDNWKEQPDNFPGQ